jgi:tRNA 2-thiouridine synthesizing protein A
MRAMPDKTLDTKGLACPLPILKTKKALSELPKGAKLEVLATDPGSVPDFQAFCATTGNLLVEHSEQAGVYRFVIQHV